MHGDGDAIDVEGHPELEQLAAEVCASEQPRILRRNGREVARVVPVGPHRKPASDEQWAAMMATAGSWADVDADKFLETIYAARDAGSKAPVDL